MQIFDTFVFYEGDIWTLILHDEKNEKKGKKKKLIVLSVAHNVWSYLLHIKCGLTKMERE